MFLMYKYKLLYINQIFKMNFLLLLIVALGFFSKIICHKISSLFTLEEDAFRNVSELISSKGYPVENHIVQTSDGYLLSIQRIPHGKVSPITSKRRPTVFLMHGLFGDSTNFLWNFPKQSLGYLLADNGYDVWMGNVRGNTYSKNHVRLSPKDSEFWNFSLDEIIEYDLPAMIDYVLEITGEKKLSYIGYSQGNTIAFGLLSKSPLYNKKINLLVALAPIVKFGYFKETARFVGRFLQLFYKNIGPMEIFAHKNINNILKHICATEVRYLCPEVVFPVTGGDAKQLNYTRLPVYVNNFPAGTSTKITVHFGQMEFSNRFQKYNYHKRNKEYYNQDIPPEYDVSKITTPIALLSGQNDALATQSALDALRHTLNSLVSDYVIPFADFDHIDFILAIDAYSLLNEKIISLLKQFNRN